MIKISYKKTNNIYKEIIIKGHANYDEEGKDIVCSAVSTASIVTINAFYHLKLEEYFNVDLKDGYIKLNILKFNETLNKLLENLEYNLNELKDTYSKYIKIEQSEV